MIYLNILNLQFRIRLLSRTNLGSFKSDYDALL